MQVESGYSHAFGDVQVQKVNKNSEEMPCGQLLGVQTNMSLRNLQIINIWTCDNLKLWNLRRSNYEICDDQIKKLATLKLRSLRRSQIVNFVTFANYEFAPITNYEFVSQQILNSQSLCENTFAYFCKQAFIYLCEYLNICMLWFSQLHIRKIMVKVNMGNK